MVQIVSLVGALLTLLAYFMIATQRWSQKGYAYHTISLVSCFLLGYVSVVYKNMGYILLNLAWAAVAVHTLFGFYRDKSSQSV